MGGAAVSVALSWQQSRAAASIDRSGWGAGWTIGSSFVSVVGLKRVYPADGGSFLLDPSEASGLKDYKLHDLSFATRSGTLPARTGASAVSYSYTLTYDDGRVDYFDANGNLAARVDRFGDRTDLVWRGRANNVWQPTSIIDSYGLTTSFDYSVVNQVKLLAPRRSDGVVSNTTIALTTSSGVQSVTDPVGQRTGFGYASFSGAPKPLLTQISAPSGAKTAITYQSPTYEPSLSVVKSLAVTDANGSPISPAQTFSLDPPDNNRHNFTGYPNHLSTGGADVLFESGDPNYVYSTSLTTGTTTTVTTYDALSRQTKRTVSVAPAVGETPLVAQTQQAAYDTPVQKPGNLPANFAQPDGVSLTQSSATSAQGITAATPRTTTTTMSYDDHGRVISSTDEVGTTTNTVYDDRYGQVIEQTTIGKDGTESQLINTLSGDGRNIDTSVTSVGKSALTLSARQELSFGYDAKGQLTTRTLTWAPGAKPVDGGPGGGPDKIVTTFDRSISTATASETLTTTVAAGTSSAESTMSTIDLVTDEATSTTDALGRITSQAFDALGRPIKVVTPGGLTTITAYAPTATTETDPSGRMVRTTRDLLGRTTSVTDNVRDGAFTTDPATRSLSTASYSADGSTVTGTDQTGQHMKEVLDPFGRVVSRTGPSGVVQLTSYDNGAAHDKTDSTVPVGSSAAAASTVSRYDDANRGVQARTTYPDDPTAVPTQPGFIADPVSSATFNGLGQTTTSTAQNLTVTPDHSGPGGIDVTATADPTATVEFPGTPITATTSRDLTGAATSRTLHQGDKESSAVSVEYDAAGRVVAATDPSGRVTRYTYNSDGQPITKSDPSGTVTTYTYGNSSGLRSGVTMTAPGKATRALHYTWVPNGQSGAGQLKTVSDGTGTISYGYDADGHRTSVAYPDGTSTSAAYDDQGQLTSTTDVTGAVTTFAWDAAGRLGSATQERGATVLASESYSYDSLSRLDTTSRGNGTVTKNTYTATNLLASQTTTSTGGSVVEAHSYTYNTHREPASRTDTYPTGSNVSVPLSGTDTWTTVYSYDAYDRLIASAVHAGTLVDGKPSGLAATATRYTLDVGGDVTAKSVTTRLPGLRPTPVTTTTTNTIDASGRLTGQQVGTTTSTESYDDDGRVVTALNGNVTTYAADGAPASVTLPNGSKTVYAFWPDGNRRSAKTTGVDGRVSTVTFHYGTDGNLINDTTADAGTGTGTAATASYLLTTGRDARTLLPDTTPSGAVRDTPQSPITTGTGVGYYLRDRHSSVTSQIDASGAVTGTYAYTDYGAPARADGQSLRVGSTPSGRANPYTYLGAAPGGPWTSAVTGLQVFSLRSYNSVQGRFTTPDPVDAHNRYQAFDTNPILYADVAGGISTPDIILDCVFAFVFAASVVFTFGAASAAVGVAFAAFEVGELTAGVVINVAANVIGFAANVTGAVTSTLLAADDIVQAANQGKKHLFSATDRANISFASEVATLVGGVSGVAAGLTDFTVGAAEEATAEYLAADQARLARPTNPVGPDIPPVPTDAPPPLPLGNPPAPDVPGNGAPQINVAEQPGVPPVGEGQVGAPNPDVNQVANPAGQGPNAVVPAPEAPVNPALPVDGAAPPQVPQPAQLLPAPNPLVDAATTNANTDVPRVVQNMAQVDAALVNNGGQQVPPTQTGDAIVQRTVGPNTSNTDLSLRQPRNFENTNVLVGDGL